MEEEEEEEEKRTISIFVGEPGGKLGKQVGSMNEASQVRGCYSKTFIYTSWEMV